MNKKIFPLMAAAAMMLLTACYHDKHEFTPNEFDGKPVGYVAPQLLWEDEADAAAIGSINALSFQVQGANGVSRARSFSSIEESADWLQQLPVGEYDILVTADMDEPSGYVLASSGSPAGNLLTPTSVSLREPASSPRQSWYAVTHVTISEDKITVAEFRLRRLLTTLTLNIGNMPESYTINAKVEHIAQSVLLTSQTTAGHYGVPSEDELTVDFGSMPSTGTSFSMTKRLMPTASSAERTIIHLYLVTPQGIEQDCTIDAPNMQIGQNYKLDLNYDDIHPYIYIKSTGVNDWEVGNDLNGGQVHQ
jgi:hypothetical protein